MKQLSDALLAHYRQPVQTLARCVSITRQDGVVVGLTEHDQDLLFEGVLYHSAAGYQSTAVQMSHQLAVGTVEIEGILHGAGVTRHALMRGLFDQAQIEIFEVNYTDLSQGKLVLLCGYWGETQLQGQRFVTEFRSLAQTLQQPVGDYYASTCRAQLGDKRCGVDLSSFTYKCVVSEVVSSTEIMAADLMQSENYFAGGTCVWESGANQHVRTAIRASQPDGRLVLEAPLYPIQVGDSFLAIAGCDKRLGTCVATFNNAVNFRGEPFVPEQEPHTS